MTESRGFVVLVVSSVNTHRIVTFVCNDRNNACLGRDGFFFKNVT